MVKIKKWNSSHRGHNGVKSTHASLHAAHYPGALWARVTIGIGRPDARDRTTVSDHVLRKMTRLEKSIIQDQSAPALFRALVDLERTWS
jgi:PTH1 family peptidyl-tRNA hydrolase